ncbi:hypothetical protein GQX74_009710 [Glossina fuscipes]|nr:hypothetical protein GQX74_009710 [Glossina fuscipes]
MLGFEDRLQGVENKKMPSSTTDVPVITSIPDRDNQHNVVEQRNKTYQRNSRQQQPEFTAKGCERDHKQNIDLIVGMSNSMVGQSRIPLQLEIVFLLWLLHREICFKEQMFLSNLTTFERVSLTVCLKSLPDVSFCLFLNKLIGVGITVVRTAEMCMQDDIE